MKFSTRIITLILSVVLFSLLASGFKNKEIVTIDNLYDASVSINTEKDSTNARKLLGSGVIISKDGLILTNYHVIYANPSLSIKFNDGSYGDKVSIIKLDKEKDLALIKVDRTFPITQVAKFESLSNIYKGQPVVAIGTPLNENFFNVVSHGIISNKNVDIQMTYSDGTGTSAFIKDCIMLDFQVNGGNSGGPVFNSKGNLVGIMSSTNHKQGISFAISLEQIKIFLKDINR